MSFGGTGLGFIQTGLVATSFKNEAYKPKKIGTPRHHRVARNHRILPARPIPFFDNTLRPLIRSKTPKENQIQHGTARQSPGVEDIAVDTEFDILIPIGHIQT